MQPHPLRVCAEILKQSRIPLLLGNENLISMGGVFSFENYTLTIGNKDRELCLPINLESSGHLHLRFYSPNFMLAVHLHQDWDHGHPNTMEDEERRTRLWEGNIGTVINDLNHCKVCVTRHTNLSGQIESTHMAEDNPEADKAITNPQTGKILKKKRMYINLTEVNVGDKVYFRKPRDKYWNGPARVTQKESKSLQCVIRQDTHTIRSDGTLISKPDIFLAIEEENTITPNQQTKGTQEEEEEYIRDQLQAAEEELA